MKKVLLVLVAVLGLSLSSNAQNQKYKYMLGFGYEVIGDSLLIATKKGKVISKHKLKLVVRVEGKVIYTSENETIKERYTIAHHSKKIAYMFVATVDKFTNKSTESTMVLRRNYK